MARPRTLDSLSVADLQKLIAERKRGQSGLRKQRAKLLKELAKIDKQLGNEGGGRRGGGTRPRNSMPLAEVLAEVLKSGKPMKVPDIAAAAQEQGYKSSSPKFTAIVNQTLIKDKRFNATERGVYAMKK
jgi:hypothetical protein